MTPSIVKNDPYWLDPSDPHRPVSVRQQVGEEAPIMPWFMWFNPAYADVNAEQVWGKAEANVMTGGMSVEKAVDVALQQIKADFRQMPDARRVGSWPAVRGRFRGRCRSMRRFVHVTFPLLANLYIVCTLLSTIWTLGDSVHFVSGGGPALQTHALATLGIRNAFELGDPQMGMAAVISALPLLVPLVIYLMRKLHTGELRL